MYLPKQKKKKVYSLQTARQITAKILVEERSYGFGEFFTLDFLC